MKKPVIIYVDDEKIVLDSIKAQLKRNFDRDIEFESAESAEEALELLDELTKEGITVPLVISDHIMPNMKGDEFLTKVYEKFPEIKTILLTGQADANAVGNAVNNAHLYRYISKPWVEKDLQLTIRAAVKSFDDENQLTSLYNKLNALSGALSGDFSDSYKALNVEGTIEGDLDVLKNAIVTLVNAKESAEISAAAKAQFLATMSHELRTPLNAIIAISNLLKDGKPKSDQVENIEALNFSSKILLSLINDILDFSKIEAGKMSFEDVDINLNNFTKNIIRIHQRVTTEKGIGLNLIIEDNLPFVTADSTILEQIINNLLSNAIKFTAEGAVEFTVKKGKETEEYCTFYFQVKDSGIGIPQDKLEHIFDSYAQSDADTTRNYGGTGLGLTITRKLVELQGGEIDVKSTLGEGATFSFSLKLKKLNNCKKAKQLAENGQVDNSEIITFEQESILLVEDNKINTFVVLQFLDNWHLKTTSVVNGQEAVDAVKNGDFKLVLMDCHMPVLDGFEATIEIRKTNTTIPILALTASITPENQERILECGMNDFEIKPFDPENLNRKIGRFLNYNQ